MDQKHLEQISQLVTDGYQKIEDTVVDGYRKIETAVVEGYTKIEDSFVERHLARAGETADEAKRRLKAEQH